MLNLLQLNVSGCDCVPEDCEQTNNAFEQLTQSTEQCFADFNFPINDVARKILNDADDLYIQSLKNYMNRILKAILMQKQNILLILNQLKVL